MTGRGAKVAALLEEERLPAGSKLFAEGDVGGDALYVVGSGTVAVVGDPRRSDGEVAAAGEHRGQRFLSASAGMMLGELALLDGGGRTGHAIAETDILVYRLSQTDIARLRAEDPALAAALYQNIAVHLSQRLRAAVTAWRADAG